MDVIIPQEITDDTLISSTVPVDDAPEWVRTDTYSMGEDVVHDLQLWRSTIDENTLSMPSETNTDWARRGYVNRWRMFREGRDSKTRHNGGFVVEIDATQVLNGIAILGCEGLGVSVTMTDPVEGVVYQRTESITDIGVTDFWEWHYLPYQIQPDFAFLDLPPYAGATIRIEITASGENAPAAIGRYSQGIMRNLGVADHGTSIRRRSFSVNEEDAFGNLRIVRRRQIPLADYRVSVPAGIVDNTIRILENLQDEPAVFIGAAEKYGSTIVFGYYRDYDVTLATPTLSDMTIEVRGY